MKYFFLVPLAIKIKLSHKIFKFKDREENEKNEPLNMALSGNSFYIYWHYQPSTTTHDHPRPSTTCQKIQKIDEN